MLLDTTWRNAADGNRGVVYVCPDSSKAATTLPIGTASVGTGFPATAALQRRLLALAPGPLEESGRHAAVKRQPDRRFEKRTSLSGDLPCWTRYRAECKNSVCWRTQQGFRDASRGLHDAAFSFSADHCCQGVCPCRNWTSAAVASVAFRAVPRCATALGCAAGCCVTGCGEAPPCTVGSERGVCRGTHPGTLKRWRRAFPCGLVFRISG